MQIVIRALILIKNKFFVFVDLSVIITWTSTSTCFYILVQYYIIGVIFNNSARSRI